MREPDFELSADMRLLELQRGALGLAPREPLAWESREIDAGTPLAAREEPAGSSAVLAVEMSATPAEGVIAGAVVTFALSIANEGGSSAMDVVAGAPLPGGGAYRPGSFVWNGRSTFDDVAERFFGEGLAIGAIGAGERAGFAWKVGVRLGSKPLSVTPRVVARGAGVIGAKPLHVGRKPAAPGSAFGSELDRAQASLYAPRPLIPVEIPATELPIYELDEEEQLVHEAAEAALAPIAVPRAVEPESVEAPVSEPVAQAPVSEPVAQAAVNEPVAQAPVSEPLAQAPVSEPVAQAPVSEPVAQAPVSEPVAQAPVSEPVAQPEPAAPLLVGQFERSTLAFFERIFASGKPVPILQHAILGGALGCTDGADGSLRKHLDGQSSLLHRIVLHERLGKKEPIAEYAGALLADLTTLDLAPPPVAPSGSASIALTCEISAPSRNVLESLADPAARWDFVKARQFTLAVMAQRAQTDDAALRERAAQALRGYAQASVNTLQKLFVRIRIDRTTGVLFANEPTLDDAARDVLAAFAQILARY